MAVDIGTALSEYEQGNTSDLIALLQRMNLPLSAQTTQFLGDELDAEIASGRTGLFNGWSLPAGADSRTDFFSLMTDAEAFAAASGYQYFPTPQQLQWAVEHGMSSQPQQAVWSWMASLHSQTANQPWLQSGMTQQQYKDFNNRLLDTWQQYTGDLNAPSSILQQAARENWSAQRFQQFLQNDPTVTGKYGWVAHGMTYNDFQQYKLNNKAQAAQRFGAHAGDSQYLTMLKNPLTQFAEQSSAFQSVPQAPSGPATAGASGFGRQGEAR